jgi:hypothetical protein
MFQDPAKAKVSGRSKQRLFHRAVCQLSSFRSLRCIITVLRAKLLYITVLSALSACLAAHASKVEPADRQNSLAAAQVQAATPCLHLKTCLSYLTGTITSSSKKQCCRAAADSSKPAECQKQHISWSSVSSLVKGAAP